MATAGQRYEIPALADPGNSGSVVAVSISEGWGPHTRRDDVLFIGSRGLPGVHATLNAATVRRVQRQHRRPNHH